MLSPPPSMASPRDCITRGKVPQGAEGDPNVSRDLLGTAIMEPLVYRRESLRNAWKYVGPKMRKWRVPRSFLDDGVPLL
jgi:hypothetical protein